MSSNPDSSIIADPDLKRPEAGLYGSEFWGISRHQAIAGAAEQLLMEPTASAVAAILNPLGESLADMAGWADRIKRRRPRPDDDPDTRAFLEDHRNDTQPTWHYVNLPVDAEGYDRGLYPSFTRDTDVVQMLAASILVLRGQSQRFTRANALRLVTHLAGDVHQPVHVGCGYVDESAATPRLVRDPARAEGLESDRGGNRILLPIGANGTSLHGYWDSRLGGGAGLDGGAALVDESPALKRRFIAKLSAMIDVDHASAGHAGFTALNGPLEQWPVTWATTSLGLSREAYNGLAIARRRGVNYEVTWTGREDYDTRCKPIVMSQLKEAAQNLARLLTAIFQ
jgi:hypothetical protein